MKKGCGYDHGTDHTKTLLEKIGVGEAVVATTPILCCIGFSLHWPMVKTIKSYGDNHKILWSQPQLLPCITCSILTQIAFFSSHFLRFYKIHKYRGLDLKMSKKGT